VPHRGRHLRRRPGALGVRANGRTIDHEQYGFKLVWLARLASYLGETCDPDSDVAVCGDFNIAPDDRDVWDPAAFVDATHVSQPERQALQVILDWGLEDVYRRHHIDGGVFSWWTTEPGTSTRVVGCASTWCW